MPKMVEETLPHVFLTVEHFKTSFGTQKCNHEKLYRQVCEGVLDHIDNYITSWPGTTTKFEPFDKSNVTLVCSYNFINFR